MRTRKINRFLTSLILSLLLLIGSLVFEATPVQAAGTIIATVHGTVVKGTDASTLYLNTKEGQMTIKIDSDTDASACKIMLPGSTVYASVYYGSDAYLHAAKLSASESASSVSTSSKISTVTGTVMEKDVSDGIMYVNTASGEMHVKLDSTTSYNCGILYAGKGISMQVARGDDAYMHAISITDYSAATNTYATATSASASTSTASTTSTASQTSSTSQATTAITGTVDSQTKAGTGIVYLKASDGTYTLKVDSNTDYSHGFLFMPGQKLVANIYYSNGYMHAASFTRTSAQSATSTGSTAMNFSGTVSSNTTESMLYLVTSGGTMSIKLDSNTVFNGSGPITAGRSITVNCINCADEYWHAASISLNN